MSEDERNDVPGAQGLTEAEIATIPAEQIRRSYDYNRNLLPNSFVAAIDTESSDLGSAVRNTGLTMGYPAWNLLYYALLCTLKTKLPIIVETGTNLGLSTIILAQALADAHCEGRVFTVDIDPIAVAQAKRNAAAAGVYDLIHFSVGDSFDFLCGIVSQHDRIDFAFLDGAHTAPRVIAEFEIIHDRLKSSRGTVYFDNASAGGVAIALGEIRSRFGGNLIVFENCSWAPPGAALWQP